jgi:hypothetical protein
MLVDMLKIIRPIHVIIVQEFLMKLGFHIFCILLMVTSAAMAQPIPFDHFQPLKSKGLLPKEVTKLTSAKYKQQVDAFDKIDTGEEEVAVETKQFLLENTYFLDRLLLSGKVIYNDTFSNYAQRIAAYILREDLPTLKKLRFYTCRSIHVNSIGFSNGIIILNTGLLAQLENEAQLAFVIAHEIAHYKKQHRVEELMKTLKSEAKKGEYEDLKEVDDFLANNIYTTEMEVEADKLAIEYLKATDYTLKLESLYDVYQYRDAIFEDMPMDFHQFESNAYIFPESYLPKDSFFILHDQNRGENESETQVSRSSDSRRLRYQLNTPKNHLGTLKYIISEPEFIYIRNLCRFDLCQSYLHNQKYEKAIFAASSLLQKFPNNKYLEKTIAKAFYSLSFYASSSGRLEFKSVHEDYKTTSSQACKLYYLIDRLYKDPSEIAIQAARYNWLALQKFPGDVELERMLKQLLYVLVKSYKLGPEDFYKKPYNELSKEEQAKLDKMKGIRTNEVQKGRYAWRKKNTEEEDAIYKDPFSLFAFTEILGNQDFNNYYNEAKNIVKKEEDGDDDNLTREERQKKLKQIREAASRNQRKGYALGIDKVLVVDPEYYKIDFRTQDNPIKYISSENALIKLDQQINTVSASSGLKLKKLNSRVFNVRDAAKLNDMAVFNDWLREFQNSWKESIITSQYEEVQELAVRYQTRYLCVMSIVSEVFTYEFDWQGCVNLGYMPLLLPMFIINQSKPNAYTVIKVQIIDMVEGKEVFNGERRIEAIDHEDLVNAHLYDLFHQINRKRN